jgi:hypothetical protein
MFELPETEQEVFDKVAMHLLSQNERCGTKEDDGVFQCKYRFNGMSCAAGCLIPDEYYNELMENKNWRKLCEDKLVPERHVGFIYRLQLIHDDEDCAVEDWRDLLIDLAHQHGLSVENLPKKV